MFFLTCLCSWFVVEQTGPLYESLQFSKPTMMAWGAILMAVCFAGLSAKISSRWIGAMCAVVVLYEIMFVGFGTRNNEENLAKSKHDTLPQVIFEHERLDRAKAEYLENKARYEDHNDKVFHNSWFKKTYLDPSWVNYQAASESLQVVNKSLADDSFFPNSQMWLKLTYRLCAVILSMILSAITIRKLLESFSYT